VTWHLGDSLPSEKLAKLRREKEAWEIFHPKPWDEVLEREYHDLFSRQVDAWLDQGMGECLLRDTRAAGVVADVLMHDQDRLYEIDCCAIMPNHVHVLVRFLSDEGQSHVLKSWKGISARRINAIHGRKGEFWMEGYWDRFIRNERHFETTRKYILENPRKAGLHKGYLLYSKEYARG
jgi:REP element-mobilizing transposase RayT